ncbi:MAG: hypothetical protein GY721_02400 [Deltaproteobacteria bacterium]|nr:hypothetical protein [Deltaproteobacteria bacterium]
MNLIIIIPFLASLGFLLAVITFIAGFRMVRRPEQQVELLMHRVDGIITIVLYILLAVVSLAAYGMHMTSLLLWAFGFGLHMFKLYLVRKRLAIRYGGYMGAILITTWLIIIFSHLPS